MCRNVSGWNFVDADMLWHRLPKSVVCMGKRIDEIDWGYGVFPRINHIGHYELIDGTYIFHQITMVRELVQMSEAEILRNANVGRKTLDRIKAKLREYDLTIGR
jgi:hypothetical protein